MQAVFLRPFGVYLVESTLLRVLEGLVDLSNGRAAAESEWG